MWTHRRSGLSDPRGQYDHRNPYERDYTRVIHAAAFRRLQRKTQILGSNTGDFHRTRLTHSLEVASIGRSVIHNLHLHQRAEHISGILPSDDLIQVIGLLHDIGHPPFGHGGEVALNYMMRNHGGFEGNAQALRLVTKIENSYEPYGLDLTRRTLLGILKYPMLRSQLVAAQQTPLDKPLQINDWRPPKSIYDAEQAEIDWILQPFETDEKQRFLSLKKAAQAMQHGESAYCSLDCSIMEVADDIAYGVHDLEDAIYLKMIVRETFDESTFQTLRAETPLPEALFSQLFAENSAIRKQAIGALVNYFITETQLHQTHEGFEHPIFRYNIGLSPTAAAFLHFLKSSIYHLVIDSHEARISEYAGQNIVMQLFDAISANPLSLLDLQNRKLYFQVKDEASAQRVVCDYIANMTDEYASRMHERLFGIYGTRS
ncbi:MAG: anti-phage deoxyguanosine triphosphatase [Legionellaceae bacterium]|nr:anti-phage deoxyguanosine triphosphatase [Legionellaceae bacterium]